VRTPIGFWPPVRLEDALASFYGILVLWFGRHGALRRAQATVDGANLRAAARRFLPLLSALCPSYEQLAKLLGSGPRPLPLVSMKTDL
jgi:hypothetical protein